MTCYHPLRAYRKKTGPLVGRWPITFSIRDALTDDESVLTLPCGQCIGCRIDRSREWAIRCMHEASCWSQNCFVTLTYDDDHIKKQCGKNLSLNKRDFVLFIKRLRHYAKKTIRYYHCGEYGEERGRPHHHAALFNIDFSDKQPWRETQGVKLYCSPALAVLWPYGYHTIGEVTWESAAYIARYVTKKITGELAQFVYKNIQPPYSTMSRRAGIGSLWLEQYANDVYNYDRVISRGMEMRAPRFYDKIFDKVNGKKLEQFKIERKRLVNKSEQTGSRLNTRETIVKKNMKLWRREPNGKNRIILCKGQ